MNLTMSEYFKNKENEGAVRSVCTEDLLWFLASESRNCALKCTWAPVFQSQHLWPPFRSPAIPRRMPLNFGIVTKTITTPKRTNLKLIDDYVLW
jgi:hypothetical protein